jgi:acyl-CoA thioester hydrolase
MKSESAPDATLETGAFDVTERVRWADVDRAGIILFGAYARLIDVAESEFYRSLGYTFATFDGFGVDLTRVHVEFDFFKPAELDDELVLRPRVNGVGIHSVRLKVNVYRRADQALLAEVTLVSACVDKKRKPAPLPAAFADALRAQISR